MEDLKETIRLRCTFCRSHEFALPYAGYSPSAGSLVVCANCGNENDVTSLFVVAKAIGISIAHDYADKLVAEMKSELIKSFRHSKFIKIR